MTLDGQFLSRRERADHLTARHLNPQSSVKNGSGILIV